MAARHWSERGHERGVFARIMVGLAAESAEHKTIMMDATYLKAYRTASSLRVSSEDQKTVRGAVFPTDGGVDVRSAAQKAA